MQSLRHLVTFVHGVGLFCIFHNKIGDQNPLNSQLNTSKLSQFKFDYKDHDYKTRGVFPLVAFVKLKY